MGHSLLYCLPLLGWLFIHKPTGVENNLIVGELFIDFMSPQAPRLPDFIQKPYVVAFGTVEEFPKSATLSSMLLRESSISAAILSASLS